MRLAFAAFFAATLFAVPFLSGAAPTPTPAPRLLIPETDKFIRLGTPTPKPPTPTPTPTILLTKSCPAGSVMEGVDVSHYNGTVNWKQVRASGRTFAYAKATDGTILVDPTFAQNYAGIKAAGLVRGAFHTFHAGLDGTSQANHFMSTIGTRQPGDLPPALDVEGTVVGQSLSQVYPGSAPVPLSTVQAEIGQWTAQVKAATGRTPIVYSPPSLLSQVLGSGTSGYLLWIANWGVTCPSLPAGAHQWAFWQYSGTGAVPGIPGQVALDRFNGTLAGLKSLAK
jgi:lysozyme